MTNHRVTETGRRRQEAANDQSQPPSLMSNRNGGDYQEVIETLRRTQLIFEEDDNTDRRQSHSPNNDGDEMSNNHNSPIGNAPPVPGIPQCQMTMPPRMSPPPILTPTGSASSGTVQQGKTFARVQGSSPGITQVSTPAAQAMQSVAPHIPIVGAGADDSSAEILSVFECPVCLEYMLPPYMQCPSGHLVCSNCRPKLQCCPTCRGPTPSVRNLGLEKIANTVRFPCRFSNSGCPLNFHHIDKIEHEELCEYRPYSCPCPGASCKWQGALSDVMDHLKRVHKSITTLQGEDIVFLATDINLPGAVDWVMMQSCFDYNFMLVLVYKRAIKLHKITFILFRKRKSWNQRDDQPVRRSTKKLFSRNGSQQNLLNMSSSSSRFFRRHAAEMEAGDLEYD
uniref:RING-type E3 ubiquitin transferase n=1 Tax=Caenorhabditis japonica TaxID=281687 RepID=A0A8R1I880_CAEJA